MKGYDFSNLAVLVVEHNTYMRQTMRSILRTFNIGDVTEAKDLDNAWELFCEKRPDIVFVDWAPNFDGMSLLRRIRRDPDSPDMFAPVIVVTALAEKEHVLTARDLGMTEFIAKPFSPRLIYMRLRLIAEQPRAFVRVGNFFGPERRRRAVHVPKERRDEHGNDNTNATVINQQI